MLNRLPHNMNYVVDKEEEMFNKTKTRLGAILTAVAMLTAVMSVTVPTATSATASIAIGKYLEMGTYYGEPILWRCVDIDENGPLMLSDKIICLKAFDAAGYSTIGSHGRGYDDEFGDQGWYRRASGSNYWADSNIRDWLNSTASAGNVNWSCGNPPDDDHVRYGNGYEDEAGFLTNFTQVERNAIKEVTQKSLLDAWEYSDARDDYWGDGNSPNPDYHIQEYDISSVLQNYDTAFSEQVTDRVFLLDVKQINAVYNNRRILGSDYYMGEPTAQAVANFKDTDYPYSDSFSPSAGEKWPFWLRSPVTDISGYFVRSVFEDVNSDDACDDSIGVRPAFYLDLSTSSLISGYGTASAPYRVGGETPTAAPTVAPTTAPTAAPTATPTPATVSYPYTISSISLQSQAGEALEAAPVGRAFIAAVSLTKTVERSGMDYCFVAVYDKKGKLLSLDYVLASFIKDAPYTFGFHIPAQTEEIGEIRAFVWSSFGSAEPLAAAQSLTW